MTSITKRASCHEPIYFPSKERALSRDVLPKVLDCLSLGELAKFASVKRTYRLLVESEWPKRANSFVAPFSIPRTIFDFKNASNIIFSSLFKINEELFGLPFCNTDNDKGWHTRLSETKENERRMSSVRLPGGHCFGANEEFCLTTSSEVCLYSLKERREITKLGCSKEINTGASFTRFLAGFFISRYQFLTCYYALFATHVSYDVSIWNIYENKVHRTPNFFSDTEHVYSQVSKSGNWLLMESVQRLIFNYKTGQRYSLIQAINVRAIDGLLLIQSMFKLQAFDTTSDEFGKIVWETNAGARNRKILAANKNWVVLEERKIWKQNEEEEKTLSRHLFYVHSAKNGQEVARFYDCSSPYNAAGAGMPRIVELFHDVLVWNGYIYAKNACTYQLYIAHLTNRRPICRLDLPTNFFLQKVLMLGSDLIVQIEKNRKPSILIYKLSSYFGTSSKQG